MDDSLARNESCVDTYQVLVLWLSSYVSSYKMHLVIIWWDYSEAFGTQFSFDIFCAVKSLNVKLT